MHSDSYYRIGASHDVCQDYARSRQWTAAVSDGCSSSPDTDWGARLMCAAEGSFTPIASSLELARLALSSLPCSMSTSALDATSLGIHVDGIDGAFFSMTMIGDGAHVVVHNDGTWIARVRHYDRNCPFYARYSLEERQLKGHSNSSSFSTWDTYNQDGLLAQKTEPNNYEEPRFVHRVAVWPTRMALVLTDGAESFVDAHGKPIPITQVIEQLVAVKTFEGAFMQRRCRSFFNRFCAEHGWTNRDDFAVAAYYFGRE